MINLQKRTGNIVFTCFTAVRYIKENNQRVTKYFVTKYDRVFLAPSIPLYHGAEVSLWTLLDYTE